MLGSMQAKESELVHSDFDAQTDCSEQEIWAAAHRFAAWLDRVGYKSYDPYDIWGTRYGQLARRLYYRHHPAGIPLVAPLILMEIVCPSLRGLFVKKDRFPTADAQLTLAFLNLYEASQDRRFSENSFAAEMCHDRGPEAWLTKAKNLANELLNQSVSGFSGFCWGYPFDWQNVNGLMPKGTPHITATPYCYEAFIRLFDLTGENHYLDVAQSIARFVSEDLRDTPTGKESAAASYTPHDNWKVVNASAYRAFVLFNASQRFQNDTYRVKAWKNLRFILQNQKSDGSWLYAIDDPAEAFIDHFHTCFVLKNLFKLNRHLNSADVRHAINGGYAYYRNSLFDEQDNPKLFAIAPRLETVCLEMYNVAEAISLGVLLRNDIPKAFALSKALGRRLIQHYELPAGHWVTRVYHGRIKHTVPFLRWPQAQLFLALTNLLFAASANGSS